MQSRSSNSSDRTANDRYQARFMQVFTKFDGTVLAADEAHWRFVESTGYQDISKDRRAGADTVVLLVEGPA
jgi:hypothetical protein